MSRAIRAIQGELGNTGGRLTGLQLDLSDLPTIRHAAEEFLAKEDRLDVLVHNAGVMTPPAGSTTKLVGRWLSFERDACPLSIHNPGIRFRDGHQLSRSVPLQPLLGRDLETDSGCTTFRPTQ